MITNKSVIVLILFFFLNLFFCISADHKSAEDIKEEKQYNKLASLVAEILVKTHYSRKKLDKEMSKKFFYTFLENLDPNHYYFTQEDVDMLSKKYESNLADLVFDNNSMVVAKEVCSIFYSRLKYREDKNISIIENGNFDLTTDESVKLIRDDRVWPKDKDSSDKLWKRIITNEYISNILASEIEEKSKEVKENKREIKKLLDSLDGDASLNFGDYINSLVQIDVNELSDDLDSLLHVFTTDDIYSLSNKLMEKKVLLSASEKEKESIKDKMIKDHTNKLKLREKFNTPKEIYEAFIKALAETYDPHTNYDNASDNDTFLIHISNKLVGIGAVLESIPDDGSAKIKKLIVGGPALKSGKIKINDRIIAVAQDDDGEMVDIRSMTLGEAVTLIRGESGKKVRLKIKREVSSGIFEEKIIPIIREMINLKENLVYADFIEIMKNSDKGSDGNNQEKIKIWG